MKETNYTVSDLTEGTTYEFRVCAENKAGRSDLSMPSSPVVLRQPVSGQAPVVQEHLNDAYAKVGESASFECRVTGEPEPDISW